MSMTELVRTCFTPTPPDLRHHEMAGGPELW
jgi:hypothetical protein